LQVLADRVRHKREIFKTYRQALGDLPGIDFMPEAPWGRAAREGV
jgi:dTDP-4-amino-4,6-dideoxygalactose transaminase